MTAAQIAREFHFTDAERDQRLGGDIALAFFCLGAPVALLCGWLARLPPPRPALAEAAPRLTRFAALGWGAQGDQFNRKRLFVAVVVLGAAPCLGTYWITTYWRARPRGGAAQCLPRPLTCPLVTCALAAGSCSCCGR